MYILVTAELHFFPISTFMLENAELRWGAGVGVRCREKNYSEPISVFGLGLLGSTATQWC